MAVRVFLIDDDAAVLTALSRLLREAGFDVEAFQSPSEFLLHDDASTPGCAVLDVALGDWNGLEVQSALANKGDARPIIFITGQGDIATSVQAMKAGAVDFLTKPVRDEDLIEAVRRALERDRATREEEARLASVGERLASLTPREQEVLSECRRRTPQQTDRRRAWDCGEDGEGSGRVRTAKRWVLLLIRGSHSRGGRCLRHRRRRQAA